MEAEHRHNWDRHGICRNCHESLTQYHEEVEKEKDVLRRRRDHWQSQGRPDIAAEIQKQIDQLPEVRWTTSEILVV